MTPPAKSDKAADKITRIVLVDDHPIVRERLSEIINGEPDLSVCAEAEDRTGALQTIEAAHPQLVIIDLALKNSNGLELIKDIRARWPKVLMLVVSMHDESLYAERVIRAGARGYITKQEATRRILQAIRRVLSGEIYLNEKTAAHVLGRLTGSPRTQAGSVSDLLTDRELEVFDLTGSGLNTRDIAERLRIDVKTVETYRVRIKEKLNLKGASELLQLAIRWKQDPGNSRGL
ncbi:MAG: response regulator transcription factor [Verrucomicrobiota bacterium]